MNCTRGRSVRAGSEQWSVRTPVRTTFITSAHRSTDGFGAFILGRNMFGPTVVFGRTRTGKAGGATTRPFLTPTFVLTHHPRDPIVMEGGTTFIFVTNGLEAASEQAKQSANGRDVKFAAGVETARQYRRAGLIKDLNFALSPVVLGQGEAMFAGIDLPALGYRVTEYRLTEHATHLDVGR